MGIFDELLQRGEDEPETDLKGGGFTELPVNKWLLLRPMGEDNKGHSTVEMGDERRAWPVLRLGLEVVGAGTAWVGGDQPQQWTATIYPGPKGNFVFNAATIFWSQGLSHPPGHTLPWSHWSRPHGPDERVQRITHNLIQRALRK